MGTSPQANSESQQGGHAMTGRELRQLRERLGVSQKVFASLIGLTKSALSQIEWRDRPVRPDKAAAAGTIEAAQLAGAIVDLPKKKRPIWRDSTAFQLRPPFEALPENGTACGCGNLKCRLTPVRDGDWPECGHLWIFQGPGGCGKRVYLDADGKKVSSPRKVAAEVCSACGRTRGLGPKESTRLGERIWIRRCRPDPNDPPSLKHDPPTYWRKRNGRLERLPEEDIEKLHGRNTRSFPVPKCELDGCSRHGKTMERSAVLHLVTWSGDRCEIATYRCRPPKPHKPHPAYRVLPHGEIATRLGMGRYRWTDQTTGETIGTVPGKRPVRADRVMPAANCPECGAPLRKLAGPWKLKAKHRRWKAECSGCHKIYRVRNDGEIREYKDSRWYKPKPGPKKQAEETKKYFVIGHAVEELIPELTKLIDTRRSLPKRIRKSGRLTEVELRNKGFSDEKIAAALSAKTGEIAARNMICQVENLQYDRVAKLHREYKNNRDRIPNLAAV